MKSLSITALGQRLFPFRLIFGLTISLLGFAFIKPTPFFDETYVWLHAIAVFGVLGGLLLRAWGSGTAGLHTRSDTIEAPCLVTGGPFAYLRNPIYAGNILIGASMSVVIGDPIAYICSFLAFSILYFTIIPSEEEFLRSKFNKEYLRYTAEVPRIIPRLTPWRGRIERGFSWKALKGEFIIVTILIAIYTTLRLKEYWFNS